MMGELLEDINDIAELKSLNDYVDKIKVGLWRNFILVHDLKIQIPKPADISKNFGAKPFLKGIQACWTLNLKKISINSHFWRKPLNLQLIFF